MGLFGVSQWELERGTVKMEWKIDGGQGCELTGEERRHVEEKVEVHVLRR